MKTEKATPTSKKEGKKIIMLIKKLLGIKCFHRWVEVRRSDWLIDERCEKCGNSALRMNP